MKRMNRLDFHNRKAVPYSGSLTVEAALTLPIFIFFIIVFLYFIQIFYVQEYIQRVITRTGLSLAKTAYVYDDFIEAIDDFDLTLFGEELDIGISDLAHAVGDGTLVKALVKKDMDTEVINHSSIQDGFKGISFYYSRILEEEDCIDIIVRYRVRIPIRMFALGDMRMIQRVRLRGWTGHKVAAQYSIVEGDDNSDETIVYITKSGTVYHRRDNCSHIKLSIREVSGIPLTQRNQSGGRYYPCETCCMGEWMGSGIYYITDYGDRYHIVRDCSALKRTVLKIPLSEVGDRTPCKRCGT